MIKNQRGVEAHEILFSEKWKIVFLLVSFFILIAIISTALSSGAYSVNPFMAFKIVMSHIFSFLDLDIQKIQDTVIWKIRAPRVMLAALTGMTLATSGVIFQGCFRNPLVDPYILGVSSGAAFGAALGFVFTNIVLSTQILAFAFGTIAVFGSYTIARTRGETPVISLILAGVIIGSIFSALVSIMKYIASSTALREIVFWLMGGFYYANWDDVLKVSPFLVLGFSIVWLMGWKLNIISMGDEQARSLGVHPEKYKMVLIMTATLQTALAVSLVGVIPWVGLMMPHAARMMLGPDHRFLIPCSAIFGALYLIVCDTLARTISSAEIPVGIITSLAGAPYLFYLLRAKRYELFG